MSTKIQKILETSASGKDRAKTFAPRIEKSIKRSFIDDLEEKILKLDDEIFKLTDFSLDTDLNKGQQRLTKEEVESNITRVVELEYEKALLSAELKVKQEIYKEYFV